VVVTCEIWPILPLAWADTGPVMTVVVRCVWSFVARMWPLWPADQDQDAWVAGRHVGYALGVR
jgi:hypothetical protein